MTISTGVYLTKLLAAYGVDVVFGIPGVHTVELYRGLSGGPIRHVTPRHEQGAGFMADGYARTTGKPGVAFVITGPGLTNIVTAMGQAYADSIPMLVISTVNAHGRMGSGNGWLHELPDQQAILRNVTAFSHTVHHPDELPQVIARAFAVFDGARPRPVHVELPINVMLADASHLPEPDGPCRLSRPMAQPTAIAEAAALLSAADRPVILAGGGARWAASSVQQLAELLDAPVAMTTNARGLIGPDHPLAVSASASLPACRQMIAEADAVLAVGTEFGSTDYDMYEDGGFSISGTLIRIDIDPQQLMRGCLPAVALPGDAALTVDILAASLPGQRRDRGGARRAAAARSAGMLQLTPAMRGDLVLLELVRRTLPEAIIAGDSTQLTYAGNLAYSAAAPGSWFNSATGYGTLGYGLPAGIGARIGAPERPVVVLAGDGGVQFAIAELASAVEAGADIIMLLHDNTGYGEIKSYMVQANIAPVGVDLATPDFIRLGQAYGWHAERVASLEALSEALRSAGSRQGPSMIVIGDDLRAEAAAPFKARH